jgi:hypothetical protein
MLTERQLGEYQEQSFLFWAPALSTEKRRRSAAKRRHWKRSIAESAIVRFRGSLGLDSTY